MLKIKQIRPFNPEITEKEEAVVAVTKKTLIDKIYNQVGLSKIQSKQVVEQLIDIIKETLENGEDLLISGFGKFIVRDKAERRGRNPHTAQDLQLRARRVVVFKTSSVLRDKMNNKTNK